MRNIDSSLLSKINKQNQTIYEDANPKLSVVVARARSSIMDASYFTVEDIRTKAGLTDISVATRRMKPHGIPDGLFVIHLDNGIAKTLYRAYPDKLRLKWQNAFTIGAGKSVATAFNGHWERYREHWQLVTGEYPYIFWVENDGKLYSQHWDDEETKVELATSVNKCKAVRGWKNVNFTDRDNGLVVGYIKNDGKVYYRNYCEQVDGSYLWELEQEVAGITNVTNINLFLTNDYRTGILLESDGKIYWTISERNWAGMAVPAEYISASPEIEIEFIKIEYPQLYHAEYLSASPAEIEVAYLFANTDNEILEVINKPNIDDDWGWIIDIQVRNPIPILTLDKVVITDIAKSTPIAMANIEKIDDFNFRLYVSDIIESGINNVSSDIKVNISGVLNEAEKTYINMEKVFTPINLVPTFIPLPEVEAIWNE